MNMSQFNKPIIGLFGMMYSHYMLPAQRLKHVKLWPRYCSSECPGEFIKHRLQAFTH